MVVVEGLFDGDADGEVGRRVEGVSGGVVGLGFVCSCINQSVSEWCRSVVQRGRICVCVCTSDECVLGEFLVKAFRRGAVEVEVDALGGGDESAEGGQAHEEGAHLLVGVERWKTGEAK